jgi:hypothetical protein
MNLLLHAVQAYPFITNKVRTLPFYSGSNFGSILRKAIRFLISGECKSTPHGAGDYVQCEPTSNRNGNPVGHPPDWQNFMMPQLDSGLSTSG